MNKGQSVGRKRIVMFDTIEAVQMSLRITESVGTPLVRSFEAHYVDGDNKFLQFPEDKVLEIAVSAGQPATASEYHSTPFLPKYINDGNLSTRWATDFGSDKWWVQIDLEKITEIDRISIREGWGRIQDFKIEYRNSPDQAWKTAFTGTTVGANYSKKFEPIEARYFRLNILKASDLPTIWEWQLHSTKKTEGWSKCGGLNPSELGKGKTQSIIDVSKVIARPGQYWLRFDEIGDDDIIEKVSLLYNDEAVMDAMVTKLGPSLYNINHTAATSKEYKVSLEIKFKIKKSNRVTPEIFIKRAFK